MRLLGLVFVMMSCECLAQESPDSTTTQPFQFQQEGLLSNRSLWTFEDNPALAGFDRKLNLTYDYSAQNLSIIRRTFEGDSVLAFQQHAAMLDLPFGGDLENFGAGLSYRNVRNDSYRYHQLVWAHSYRLEVDEHKVIFGSSYSLYFSDLKWEYLSFGDMYDPRFGLIYPSNEQRPPSTNKFDFALAVGMNYNWKRIVFGYSFRYGPRELYTVRVSAAADENRFIHNLRTGYHFGLPDDVSITPEILIRNDRHGIWKFSPAVTVNYRRIGYGQIALDNLNVLRVMAGFLWNERLGINVSFGSYLNQVNARVFGLATVQAGMRFQIATRQK